MGVVNLIDLGRLPVGIRKRNLEGDTAPSREDLAKPNDLCLFLSVDEPDRLICVNLQIPTDCAVSLHPHFLDDLHSLDGILLVVLFGPRPKVRDSTRKRVGLNMNRRLRKSKVR